MAHSGKNGTVLSNENEVTEVTKWTFEVTTPIHKYASNSTGGHKAAVAGPREAKGTIETKVDGDVIWTAGVSVDLELVGPTGGDLIRMNNAVIATTPVEVEISDGNIISATYTFEVSRDWEGFGIFESI
jgi:hypothetical protein